jgi:hypothetical protein
MERASAPCQSSNTWGETGIRIEYGDSSTLHVLFSFIDNKCVTPMCFLGVLLLFVFHHPDLNHAHDISPGPSSCKLSADR